MKYNVFFARALILIFLTIVFYSCADEITTIEDFEDSNNNSTQQLSKFSKIQDKIFTVSCALSGCHGDNSTQANLNLTKGKAYFNLVNVNSSLYSNQTRIIPGNAEQSLLYRVLNGSPLQMPPTGKLNQNFIDSISVWINKGAPND